MSMRRAANVAGLALMELSEREITEQLTLYTGGIPVEFYKCNGHIRNEACSL